MTEHTVPHHFDNADQAYQSAKLGTWVFLVTEILLFGGLFVAYIMFRGKFPEMFHEASHHLDVSLGGINTVVLICSSLTMALAVHGSNRDRHPITIWFLILTLICATVFLGIKYLEYSHKIHEGLLPGANFRFLETEDPRAALFFSFYFTMTGLHGLHVVVGMGLIAWVTVKYIRGTVGKGYNTHLEMVGIYWHLVDLIWIYLFPLLYLIG